MKSIKFFFACVLALTFVACSNAESDSFEDNTSNFESMKSLYGIESAAYDQKAEEIPSVTAEEMASVLEALRQNGNTVRNCESETTEGFYGDATDKKAVKMLAEYQARTRSGAFVEQFALCVSLNFNIDKGAVYYIGTTYSSSTDLFSWQGYGASLSTTADGTEKAFIPCWKRIMEPLHQSFTQSAMPIWISAGCGLIGKHSARWREHLPSRFD